MSETPIVTKSNKKAVYVPIDEIARLILESLLNRFNDVKNSDNVELFDAQEKSAVFEEELMKKVSVKGKKLAFKMSVNFSHCLETIINSALIEVKELQPSSHEEFVAQLSSNQSRKKDKVFSFYLAMLEIKERFGKREYEVDTTYDGHISKFLKHCLSELLKTQQEQKDEIRNEIRSVYKTFILNFVDYVSAIAIPSILLNSTGFELKGKLILNYLMYVIGQETMINNFPILLQYLAFDFETFELESKDNMRKTLLAHLATRKEKIRKLAEAAANKKSKKTKVQSDNDESEVETKLKKTRTKKVVKKVANSDEEVEEEKPKCARKPKVVAASESETETKPKKTSRKSKVTPVESEVEEVKPKRTRKPKVEEITSEVEQPEKPKRTRKPKEKLPEDDFASESVNEREHENVEDQLETLRNQLDVDTFPEIADEEEAKKEKKSKRKSKKSKVVEEETAEAADE